MKLPFALLSLAAVCSLSTLTLAQGTYLNAPGNNPSNAVLVAAGGNVGIGTTAPRSRLHVKSSGDYAGEFENPNPDANAWIKILNDSRAYLVGVRGDTRDSFVIYDNATGMDRIVVDPNGNVGIGTSSPGSRLDVKGGVHASDSATLGDAHWAAEGSDYVALSTFGGSVVRGNSINVGQFTVGAWSQLAPANGLYVGGDVRITGNVRCTVIDLTSDRNAKTGFSPVDCRAVLERVARLPLTTWQYTNTPGVKHLGPMAQDFQAAFALGTDDKHIASVDADGVALASIQALYHELQQRDEQLKAKESRLAALETQFCRLEQQLAGFSRPTPDREQQAGADCAATASSSSAGDAR